MGYPRNHVDLFDPYPFVDHFTKTAMSTWVMNDPYIETYKYKDSSRTRNLEHSLVPNINVARKC